MITVKLYGLLRIDHGIRERTMDAGSIKDVFRALAQEGIPQSALNGCAILINSKPASKRSKLRDGDVVQLLPPVAGG